MYKSTDGGDTCRMTAHALQGRLIRTVLPLALPNSSVVRRGWAGARCRHKVHRRCRAHNHDRGGVAA
jgi:hypothetical protein